MSSILLRNGTVLCHQPDDHVKAEANTDVLIKGNRIAKIGKSLTGDGSTQVIDCSGKIVSPGFIDTHHHLWQTQLKGRHTDEQLLQYMASGNMHSFNYTPDDIYWGELGGCLESLDAGTTTVVDHAHLTYSPQHVEKAISATESSGIRSVFCYTPIIRAKSWTSELAIEEDMMPAWLMETFDKLAKAQPFGEGRIRLGFGFDFFFLPQEVVVGLFEKVRKAGVKLITTHFTRNPIAGNLPNLHPLKSGNNSTPSILESYGLVQDDLLYSHATGATKEDCELMTKSNSYVSTTPDTEGQMLGMPMTFRKDVLASLGIDCHSNNPCSIVEQMRLALFSARLLSMAELEKQAKFPKQIKGRTEEAFNLGTINGARAIKMGDQLGSIAEGKLADIVVFNATSPSMIGAAQHDPLVAVVRHSSVHDISEVIVDGVVRKGGFCLKPVRTGSHAAVTEGQELSWDVVSKNLIQSREEIQKRVEKCNNEAAVGWMKSAWYIDESKLVDIVD
ncbi:MAG: hypothetical protein Q9227_005337 [Pyrenula ochraceoflavens]